MISFIPISNPAKEKEIDFLHKLLLSREFYISHRKLPSLEDHRIFVLNHPYRNWSLVLCDKTAIGSIYSGFDNSVEIFVSADGSTGAKVSIGKALLLSAITIDASDLKSSIFQSNNVNNAGGGGDVYSFASTNLSGAMDLDVISVGVFNKALENIAALRARNGGTMSRLSFAAENISTQKSNMEAALGRIVDVDVAAESTRLARNNVLLQASAAMLAQANTNPEIALMLIR